MKPFQHTLILQFIGNGRKNYLFSLVSSSYQITILGWTKKKKQFKSILISSNKTHMCLSIMLCKKLGLKFQGAKSEEREMEIQIETQHHQK